MGCNTVLYRQVRWKLGLTLLFSLFLLSCSENNNGRTVKLLKVAVLPQQSKSIQRKNYQPIIEHIYEHSGIPTKLFIPDSYEDLLALFVNKKVDMALFGGVTYIQAHLKANALPLVMRDIDGRFKSVVLIAKNNPAKSLNDLEGVSFAYGSRLSTSGHLMPRHFFEQKKIISETFFKNIRYSGAHDRTAIWVRDGKVDAGVLNAGIVNEMFRDGRLTKDKVKVLWESPPYADYVWAIQPDINTEQRIRLRNTFLHMNQDEEDLKILKKMGANYYIPASHKDFSSLEKIVLKMEKLLDDK